jgi:hypothetical protein
MRGKEEADMRASSIRIVARAATGLLFTMLVAFACKIEDENPGISRSRDGGTSTTQDATGSEAAPSIVACGPLGGPAAVRTIGDGILARVRADCRLSAAFNNVGDETHLKDCFANQVQVLAQCPGAVYPGTDSNGGGCRDLVETHQNLGLRAADYTAFVEDTQAELRSRGASDDVIRSMLSAMLGTRTAIVQDEGPYNAYCTCPDSKFDGGLCAAPTNVVDAGPTDAPNDG